MELPPYSSASYLPCFVPTASGLKDVWSGLRGINGVGTVVIARVDRCTAELQKTCFRCRHRYTYQSRPLAVLFERSQSFASNNLQISGEVAVSGL